MWPTRQHSPSRLAVTALGGTVTYVLIVLVWVLFSYGDSPRLRAPDLSFGGWLSRFLAVVVLLLPGIVIALRALSLLNEGVRLERWSDAQLDAVRAQVQRPLWTAVSGCLFVLVALSWIFARRHSVLSTAWLFLWLPLNLISSLRTAVRKPIARERRPVDWTPSKPLHSEHWGEPKRL